MTAIRLKPAALPAFKPGWKAKCFTCAHVRKSGEDGHVMRCAAVKVRRWQSFCIDARDGACGKQAVLWRAKP